MTRTPLGFFCALVALSALSAPLGAAETRQTATPSLVLRTGEHPAFDRIVFDAPRGVTYKIHRDKNAVTVAFSIAAKIALAPQRLTRAKGFALEAGADGKSPLAVRFFVSPEATIKDFMSGASIVVDVSGGEAREEKQPTPAPATQAVEEKQPPAATGAAKETPKPPSAPPPTLTSASAPTPPPPPPAQTPAPQPPSETPPAKSEDPSSLAPAPKAAPALPVQTGDALPEPSPLPALDAKTAEKLRAIASETSPKPVLSFDPQIAIGAAVYERAGYVTVLFDRKLNPPPFLAGSPQRVKAEVFDLPHNSGLRFAVPSGLTVRATRTGTSWDVYLSRDNGVAALSTEFVAQPEFALGARLLVPTATPPDPVFMTDPVVGDTLLLLPLRETSAFTIPRQLADFAVVPSAQGLVIKPWREDVTARIVPDGIEITAEGGLRLSPRYDTGAFSRVGGKAQEPGKILFDLEHWRGRAGETFTETRQKLMQTIVDVPPEQRLLARLDLARFYFAHGRGNEAASLLNFIQKELPEIETKPDFLALRGGARILAGQVASGMEDLSDPSLKDQPEATLWLAAGSALSRDWETAAERFSLSIGLLSNYPEPMRSRFMILAVEAALATNKDDKEASEWLSRFERSAHPEAANPAIRYLRGVLLAKAGRYEQAEKLWREVSRGTDRLYKIRAELALVDLGVATKSLTPKQAANRLEGLRFAWRGDDLEFDILRRLGGFYIDAKEFRMGFLMMGQALRLYPTSPEAPALRADMSKLFQDLFLSPLGEKLSPIEALELYSDFKMLMPEGDAGNKVRRNLAERLVNIDLLDQAGGLLEEIAKTSSKPEERVQTATRLAAVRLLDHKAAGAIAALDQSQADAAALAGPLQDERRLLRARALSEMGKYDEAIAALPEKETNASKLLRADIAMRAKRWPDAATALLSLVGDPPANSAALSEEKAGWLVSAALATAQGEDLAGLDKLASLYGASMDKTSKADLFHLLTHPEKASQMKDLTAAQARLSEVDMFKSFLEDYRKEDGK